MEIILTLAYTILFIALIRALPYFRIEGFHKYAIPAVFVLKIIAGIAMYFVYTYFYSDRSTADIFKYFDDSKVMYDALFKKPLDFFQMLAGIDNDSPRFEVYYNQMNYWYRVYESNIYNDSHTIIRFNALLRLFSFGYYNVHTVFMCFFSLAGLVGIYRFFEKWLHDRRRELFFAVFLLPSVLFWSSGVLKEGFLFFGLGMLLWHFELLVNKRRYILSAIIIVGSFILLLYTKFYVIIVLFPLLMAYLWCSLTSNRLSLLKFITVIIVSALFGLNIHYVFPDYDFVNILVQKQHDFINLAQSVNSGSLIKMEPLNNNILSLLMNVPDALYTSLFRPWFFEGGSPFILMAGFENLLFIAFLVLVIIFFKRSIANTSLFLICLFFAFGILILTGLTTPVMGAIVRYKVPALPFLMIAYIMLIDKKKLLKRLPFLSRFIEGKPI